MNTCGKPSKEWGLPCRPCNANDLFLINMGTQCGNCGAVHLSNGETLSYDDAIRAKIRAKQFGMDRMDQKGGA